MIVIYRKERVLLTFISEDSDINFASVICVILFIVVKRNSQWEMCNSDDDELFDCELNCTYVIWLSYIYIIANSH